LHSLAVDCVAKIIVAPVLPFCAGGSVGVSSLLTRCSGSTRARFRPTLDVQGLDRRQEGTEVSSVHADSNIIYKKNEVDNSNLLLLTLIINLIINNNLITVNG